MPERVDRKFDRRRLITDSVVVGAGLLAGASLAEKWFPTSAQAEVNQKTTNHINSLSQKSLRLLLNHKLQEKVKSRSTEHKFSSEIKVAELLSPGDSAPETWGGAGLHDAMIIYLNDSEFTGQVVFLHEHEYTINSGFTYTLLAGRNAKGEIVKGSNFKSGLDSSSSLSELNLSLGGDGGAQLRYDKDAKVLTLWMNGFPVNSPDNPTQRISFVSQVEVDQDRSRVLHHQPLPFDLDLQYYMRSGNKSTQEGGDTKFLMVAHASLKGITPFSLSPQEKGLSQTDLSPILPPTVITLPDASLYVVQPDSQNPGRFVSFVWRGVDTPDLRAETEPVIGVDQGAKGALFPVPQEEKILVNDVDLVTVKSNIESTDQYSFKVRIATPSDQFQPLISLPTLSARIDGKDGITMTQSIGIFRSIFPNLPNRAPFA